MVQYLSGMDCGHHCDNQSKAAMIQEASYFIYARDPVSYFRACAARVPPRYLRQINSSILKVPNAA